MRDETRVVRLRLTCLDAPDAFGGATEFGLQDKKQVLTLGVVEADGALRFDLTVEAVRTDGTAVRLRGPFVHGSPSAPFLYLGLRRDGAAPNEWIKRLKISLTGIDWPLIEAASEAGSDELAAAVSGHGSATVPLLGGGWQPVGRSAER